MLETDRIKLIPCTYEMINEILELEYSGILFSYKISESEYENLKKNSKIFRSFLKEDKSIYKWLIYIIISNDIVVGTIGFKGRPNEDKAVDLGYEIDKKYRNLGYATEAAKLLVDWAISTNEVKKITAVTRKDNYSSINVLKKLGMKLHLEENGFKYFLLEV